MCQGRPYPPCPRACTRADRVGGDEIQGEGCQGGGPRRGDRCTGLTGHQRHSAFTLRETVSHCRVLSRGVIRAELYLNRTTVATLLREDRRDHGWRLETQTGGSRVIQGETMKERRRVVRRELVECFGVESIAFAEGLDLGCERKRREARSQGWGLS